MRFNQPFEYTEDVIPPRCRKPRPMRFEGDIEIEVAQIDPSEAPVVIRIREPWTQETKMFEYRFFEGRFYLPVHKTRTVIVSDPANGWMATKHVPAPRKFDPTVYPFSISDSYWYLSREEREQGIREHFANFLIVGRTAYIEVGEPRWTIYTFGLGHNHGLGRGTALKVDSHYNSNIANSRYFRLDRKHEAIAEATRIAKARGDTKALPIRTFERVSILDPSVLKVDPVNEHGSGCAFINRIEGIIEGADSAGEAGLLTILATAQEVSGKPGAVELTREVGFA